MTVILQYHPLLKDDTVPNNLDPTVMFSLCSNTITYTTVPLSKVLSEEQLFSSQKQSHIFCKGLGTGHSLTHAGQMKCFIMFQNPECFIENMHT